MVLDEQNNVIFYHDKSMVYKLDLSTLKVTVLTKVYLPIQSIAHNTKTGEIYLSTSTDGKIYKLNQYFSSIQLVHESISARGSSISINSSGDILYFSKSNGRDVQIKSLNLTNKDVDNVLTLYQLNYINNLVVSD